MQRSVLLLGVSVAMAALATSASAQFDPRLFRSPQDTTPLPQGDVDARLDEDGRAQPFVRAAIASARTPALDAARELAITRLRTRVPGVAIDAHELFGTPHFVRSTLAFLSGPTTAGKSDAEGAVREFLDEYRGLFEVSPGELTTAELDRDFETQHNGLRHLTWKQRHEGVRISGCELRANLTERGEIVNVSSTLLPRPEGGFVPSPMRVSDFEAVLLAASSVGITITSAPDAAAAPEGVERRRSWVGSPDFRADEPLTTEFTWFPRTRGELRPAWLVTVPEIGIGNTYDVTIDATDGTVLRRWNHLHFAHGGTQSITMRVFTSDSPAPGTPGNATPNGNQFPFVPQQLVTITGPEVAPWSPNGWIDDGGNETLGNNVDAHLDLDANNTPDLPRPQGSPARTFDFAVDPTQAPTTYRPGAVTQIFYLANRYHDKLMEFGFDEGAKNFQELNFSGQGVGGDRIAADCQDGSGTNNANFGTSGTDGSTGRMQMYVFTGATPDRDGDLDADIVYHELSHGLSIRLLDGQASGEQAGGMGEGWGDFFGLCLNAEPGDDPSGTYTTGGYATFQFAGLTDNYYFGIRRFPYTTDLGKNPQTYADTDPAQQNYAVGIPRSPVIGNTADAVHNVGEVWCVTLWEARANLISAHGFAGNDLIMQLVVDGLKLSPGTPNFLQARDAILQADLVANGGANLSALWAGFAKRGMGASATSPAGTTTTGVVEAFDQPNLVLFTYPNGRPAQIAPGVATTFQVSVLGLGTAVPTPGTAQLHVSVDGGAFTPLALAQTSPNSYDATIPPTGCLSLVRYFVTTATNTTPASDPSTAPAATHSAIVATGAQDVLYDDFEVDLGWTPTNLGATSGDWQRGVPVNDGGWAYDPISDGDGSGSCWLTENTIGNTDVDGGAVQLLSSSFDFSSPVSTLEYEYYLHLTNTNGDDRLLVEISPNGAAGPWTTIAVHDSHGGTAWRSVSIPASTISGLGVALTNNSRLRFTANDGGTQSIVEAGVDGLRISRLTCAAPAVAYCFGDGTGGACPCGNNGDPGQGCANSLGGGATLSAAGSSILAADSLVLAGSGMPNSSALYFQGTSQSSISFGDGLRCSSGTVVRLATTFNVAGASQFPDAGDPSVSVRGLVAAPGTRTYQVWYRNAAAFCTASTFNLTNGVEATWTP